MKLEDLMTPEQIKTLQDKLKAKGFSEAPSYSTVTINGKTYKNTEIDAVTYKGRTLTAMGKAKVWKVKLSSGEVLEVKPSELDDQSYDKLIQVNFPD